MKNTDSGAFVFFGATGDLAYKQIFPALQALIKDQHLNVPIIGVAKSGWDLDQLKARAKDSLENSGKFDAKIYKKLCSLLQYIDGDYGDEETFTTLRKTLGNAKRPLYYLAIPPELFGQVVKRLASADCIKDARVVVEKPFGSDLKSARKLNKILLKSFPEENIFRIDHYLGKEPVQNLTFFRFANPVLQACWNYKFIESIQITMAEKFGVSDRGKLYDQEGALRDVVQNHLLEVIACLAMECPKGKKHQHAREERSKLLEAIRPLTKKDVVRGQFRGYHKVKGVASNSKTETFAALRLYIDNERWKNVPFYVRTGKRLPITATEVIVRFKHAPHPVLDEHNIVDGSYYRFRLSPDQVIALGVRRKKPGEAMIGESSELVAHEVAPSEMPPYERLLGDATRGELLLFAREDAVEAAWKILDPVLKADLPVHEYEPNTWGPKQAKTIEPEGGWSNPTPTPDS